MYLRYVTLLWEKAFLPSNLLYFFLSKRFFKNVMEYALPEATIGVKWECVWNGNILFRDKSEIIENLYLISYL